MGFFFFNDNKESLSLDGRLNYKSRGLKNKVRGKTQGSWRGDGGGLEEKMKRQRKGVRHSVKTEGKQEEAAKTVDVVLSSSLCRPGSFQHSKIHYYIRQSMGNFPKSTHRRRVSHLSFIADCRDIYH